MYMHNRHISWYILVFFEKMKLQWVYLGVYTYNEIRPCPFRWEWATCSFFLKIIDLYILFWRTNYWYFSVFWSKYPVSLILTVRQSMRSSSFYYVYIICNVLTLFVSYSITIYYIFYQVCTLLTQSSYVHRVKSSLICYT